MKQVLKQFAVWTSVLSVGLCFNAGSALAGTSYSDHLDSSQGWNKESPFVFVSEDFGNKIEGKGSLRIDIFAEASVLNHVYKNIQTENWSGLHTLSLWVFKADSTVVIAGSAQFGISESLDMPEPVTETYVLPEIPTGGWTHVIIPLKADGSTRNAVRSYGFLLDPGVEGHLNFDDIEIN
jgi:hypothetical protein